MKHVFTAAACAAVLLAAPAFAQEYPSSTPDAKISAGPAPLSDCKPQPNPDELCPTTDRLAIGALRAGGSPGEAGEATGLIASIDVAAGMVTLDDGKTYSTPTNVALNTFSPGQKVKLSFMNQDGHLIASEIEAADTSTPDAATAAGSGPAY